MRIARVLAAVGLVLAVLLLVASYYGRRQPPLDPRAAVACGSLAGRTPPAHVRHVVLIVMENHSGSQVVQPAAAPFTNALARACPSTLGSLAATHPSLPNYLELVAGTHAGVRSDCTPGQRACTSIRTLPSLFGRIHDWRSYEESMAAPCDRTGQRMIAQGLAAIGLYHGHYAVKHNPAAYLADAAAQCPRRDVPMGDYAHGALHDALAHDALPAFAFITPNLCDDTHDCDITRGDRFLATWVPRLEATPAYRRGDLVVLVTWDEGTEAWRSPGWRNGEPCPTADRSCRVALIAVTPWRGHDVIQRASHDALLRTIADLADVSASGLGAAERAPSLRRFVLGPG